MRIMIATVHGLLTSAVPAAQPENAGGGPTFERVVLATLLSLLALLVLTLLVQWWMWLAKLGRFAKPRGEAAGPGPVAEIVIALFTSLIGIVNEFRHFLALLLLSVFFLTLLLVMVIAWERTPDKGGIKTVTDGIQLVVASLGGLVGSIVGYYYGESAAKRTTGGAAAAAGVPAPMEQGSTEGEGAAGQAAKPGQGSAAAVKPATPPPGLRE